MSPRSGGAPVATTRAAAIATYNTATATAPGRVHLNPKDDVEGQTLAQRFESFHRRNPTFYEALVELARQFLARTGRTCGVQRLIEVARHDVELNVVSDDEFKINNSFAPFYARVILLREPDLANFFTLRKADEADAWIAAQTRGAAA
jgi:hypothetical protein